MVSACETSSFLRKCRLPGIAVCQYCGGSFCDQHGDRHNDGQEICSRKMCQRKKGDLERHVAYKAVVDERNERRLCGDPECAEAPAGQCSKCRGLFCVGHLEQRDIDIQRAGATVRVRGALCPHCRRRRSLWSQL
ncbi:MAG: hypothetical protein WD939_08195 [Dehalococcoidia bacterium]